MLYSNRKLKIPNSFKTTMVGQHKMQYEGGVSDGEKCSNIYFYLLTTVDRNEKINKYLKSVNLKPFDVDLRDFGERFYPSEPDRDAVGMVMKKVAQQNSQNLNRKQTLFFQLFLTIMINYFGQAVKEHKTINLS